MPPAPSLSENSRGVVLVLAASACFILTDTCVKLASVDLSIGQIIVVRSLIAVPIVALVAFQQRAFRQVGALNHRLIWLRTAVELGATATFLTALARIDIANATAILQLIPLAVTAAAALFLGESVGIRRWSAIFVGLAGVLLVIRPGLEGFTGWSVVVLVTVAFVAVRDLCSRMMPAGIHPLAIACLSLIAMMPLGLAMLPFSFWGPLTWRGVFLCAGSGLLLAAAYALIVQAMRHGEMAFVSPFRYAVMPLAIVVQIVAFAVWPDTLTLVGSAIVVATGLYTFYRERAVKGHVRLAGQPVAPSPPR